MVHALIPLFRRHPAQDLIAVAAAGLVGGGLAAWLGPARLAVPGLGAMPDGAPVVVPEGGVAPIFGFAADGLVLPALIFSLATLPVLARLLVQIVQSLRRGDVGLDIVAAVSMAAALAFGEALAANVVAMMYAGGQVLEAFAERRAKREMSALLGRVAQTALRYEGKALRAVPIADLRPGDRLLIRQGEVLPVDGRIEPAPADPVELPVPAPSTISLAGPVAGDPGPEANAPAGAVLDLSALTGESLPQSLPPGAEAPSGSACAGPAFTLLATRPAAESTYAGIVRLVAAAQESRAPMVRLADRYALGFLVLTLALAGLTYGVTGDPIRVLAVLVTATPCPLILAVPVALMAGLSRTARIGVLVKGGAVLEALARVRTVILDKTGTITHGKAALSAVHPRPGFAADEVLRLAASLDQASGHVVATALIEAARDRGLELAPPTAVIETPGAGLEGMVEGRSVLLGGADFVAARLAAPRSGQPPAGPDAARASMAPADRAHDKATAPTQGHAGAEIQADAQIYSRAHAEAQATADAAGAMTVAVAVDGLAAGLIVMEDRLRADARDLLADLRRAGVRRLVLASGDRSVLVKRIGLDLGFDLIAGDLTPSDKVAVVASEAGGHRGPVMMVGDGVNDAPALAAADVGVAMGAMGSASSSEAAGVVLLVDALAPLVAALGFARRSRRIAVQSVVAGLGLSLAAMGCAALGLVTPVEGALIQEGIDVAVILNALRALR